MTNTQKMRIGFCGAGYMGTPMIRRLLAKDYEVHVWNRSPHKLLPLERDGAIIDLTPASLADKCKIVCLCLSNEAAIETVVFGTNGLFGGSKIRYLIDHSTISAEATQLFSQRLAQVNQAEWIDAPVSGGVQGANAGTLAIMAGGSDTSIAELKPLLLSYSSQITHMGPLGSGQMAKMCNQIIVSAHVAAIAEAIHFAECCNLDVSKLMEAFKGGLADSKVLEIFAPRMTAPTLEKIGAMSTMLKDMHIVLDEGKKNGCHLPMTTSVEKLLQEGMLSNSSEPDLWEIINLYRSQIKSARQGK